MFIVPYWLLPLISACVWFAMLLGMLMKWLVDGRPKYSSMSQNQSIAYISDIGAQTLKPLFVTGSIITTILFNLSSLCEHWLRHKGHFARNKERGDKTLSILSTISAVCGTAGLILLSIFDTVRYPTVHNIFLFLFIGGYLLNAIFICAVYQRLGAHYPQHRILRISFWIKLAFILTEIILTIGFLSTMHTAWKDVAAVLEWIIAFIFTLYILSFIIDLPSKAHDDSVPDDSSILEMVPQERSRPAKE